MATWEIKMLGNESEPIPGKQVFLDAKREYIWGGGGGVKPKFRLFIF